MAGVWPRSRHRTSRNRAWPPKKHKLTRKLRFPHAPSTGLTSLPLHIMKPATNRLSIFLCAAAAAVWPAASQAQSPPAAPHATFHAEATPAPATPPPHEAAPAPVAPAASEAHPYLGVVTERISDDLRHQFPHIQPGAGLIVRELMLHSPAAEAKLERLDILLRWNDQLLVHPGQLQVLVASAKPGDQVTLEVLHQGTFAKAQVTLAADPGHHLQGQRQPQNPAPPAGLLSPELIQQAAAALAQSGIDPAAIAGAMQGLDLKQLNLEDLAPEALRATKILVITPDGAQQEISLAEALKDGVSIDQIMKKLDLGKIDPIVLLGSKIVVVKPDGSRQELSVAEFLKNKDVNQLLQGLQSLQSLAQPAAP